MPDTDIYLILTRSARSDRDPLLIARQAIAGGTAAIQLREKQLPRAELPAYGAALRALCRAHGVRFIVNDDPELALDLDADGVHLGQEDAARLGLAAVRRRIGPRRIIGLSTHTLPQLMAAQLLPVDYAAFGPLFPTTAKPYHIGTGDIPRVLAASRKPVVFIGGIDLANAPQLAVLGCRWLAVIRAIMQADDVTDATRQLAALVCPAAADGTTAEPADRR
ncbi:MAG TPA: thiamine phosphate synthase [bacterium]|mgnify:CR=1 FL=1|nr:thiamine phosphate synthase [bacterium]